MTNARKGIWNKVDFATTWKRDLVLLGVVAAVFFCVGFVEETMDAKSAPAEARRSGFGGAWKGVCEGAMDKLYDFEVSYPGHPEYPTVTVSSIGPDSASVTAAKDWWGLSTREWGMIAAYITVRKLGVTIKHRCRVCGAEIPKPGLCPGCAEADVRYRRRLAAVKRPDRRTEYRN